MRLFGHLDVAADESLVNGLLAGDSVAPSILSFHKTAASARQSIGRWQDDLDPALAVYGQQAFSEPLEAFGYAGVGLVACV
jgi:hypothetical protein